MKLYIYILFASLMNNNNNDKTLFIKIINIEYSRNIIFFFFFNLINKICIMLLY